MTEAGFSRFNLKGFQVQLESFSGLTTFLSLKFSQEQASPGIQGSIRIFRFDKDSLVQLGTIFRISGFKKVSRFNQNSEICRPAQSRFPWFLGLTKFLCLNRLSRYKSGIRISKLSGLNCIYHVSPVQQGHPRFPEFYRHIGKPAWDSTAVVY